MAAHPDDRARRAATAPALDRVDRAARRLGVASTAILIFELVTGSQVTSSADSLLASGTLVWVGNALVFGLLYFGSSTPGTLARHRSVRPHPDFAFTQQLSPELAPPDWRPRYVDYFVLGLTTSTAFSLTDVMPMAAWAKLAMALQSPISLTVVGLVIARAVNVFSQIDGGPGRQAEPGGTARHPAAGGGGGHGVEHLPGGGAASRWPRPPRPRRPASSRPRRLPGRAS